MAKAKKLKTDDGLYVVKATVFGNPDQTISAPLDKATADALADKIKTASKEIEGDTKPFDKVKVTKFSDEDTVETDIVKNDPYGYSILDDLDKKINGSDKEFKIKDESGKAEKIKNVKFKTK